MEALSVIASILGGGLLAALGALIKIKANAEGWRISYEREKSRADDLETIRRDAALATDIATKVSAALAKALRKQEADS